MARHFGGPYACCIMWQTILGIIATLGLAALLARQLLDGMRQQREEPAMLFGDAIGLLEDARLEPGSTAGVHRMTGTYRGHDVQVQTVVDTLAVRKLPSLWLMVTIPEPVPVRAVFDLMMRPAGPTSFSNFDLLTDTIAMPPGFPEHGVIRTDDPQHLLPPHIVQPHLGILDISRTKELLISPKGLRLVMQLAEGDRARYGVFRQAAFGDTRIETSQLRDILDRLIALRDDIHDWHRTST